MIQIPLVTIFVRHGSDCPQRDELYRRCACPQDQNARLTRGYR